MRPAIPLPSKEVNLIMENKEPERACPACGTPITFVPAFEGLPCNGTCCGCCEWRHVREPCPKEVRFGTFTDISKKMRR